MDEKQVLSNKDMVEAEKNLKFFKKMLIGCIIVLFLNCMLDNDMYLDYLTNPDDYRLSEGKIIDVLPAGKGLKRLLISYSLDGIICEGTMLSPNWDHEGDEIAIIIKGEEIGKNQFVIDEISYAILMGIIVALMMCYYEYSKLKEHNLM